jgi:alanine racemase
VSEADLSSAALVLTIDLGALVANWRAMAALAAPAECAAVVKADAYGIGIEEAVPALSAAGCRTFFVALPEEGVRVRAALADPSQEAAIYVLDGFLPAWAEAFRAARLRPVQNTPASVAAWARLGGGAPSAIHVDTGMNRLGLSLDEAAEVAQRPALLAAAAPVLLISHLACAEEPENPANAAQRARFRAARAWFPALPASLANSAGIALGADYRFDMARAGIALYGAAFSKGSPPLSPVATARARILQIRAGRAGETVGYGGAGELARDTRLAVVAAGYADGYHRAAGPRSGRAGAEAMVRGRRARLVGRVSMDLLVVDVSGIDGVAEGDWVELFGANMPIDEVAAAAGTIGYELLTGLSRRATRVYLRP